MKKWMKKITAILLAVTMTIGVAGCGGSSDDKTPKKEFYYVPEYYDLSMKTDYISNAEMTEDKLYLFGSSWNNETGDVTQYMYCYDFTSGELDEYPMEVSDHTSLQGMAANAEGNFYAIANTYEEIEGTGEFPEYRNYMEILEISSENGSVISQKDLSGAIEDSENFWVQYMAVDGQGNLYLSDGNTAVYVLDGQGNKLFSVELDNWVENLFTAGDGTVYIKTWGETGQELKPVDVQTKKLGNAITSTALSSRNYAYNQNFYKGDDARFLVSDSSGLFYYDMQNDAVEEILVWLDADINGDNVSKAGKLADGRYWVLLEEYKESGTEYSLAALKKTPASEVKVKEELVYATMWLDQGVRNNIIDFNKTNETYRITVKEYGSEDYQTSLTQFNNDLTGGNCPDLIDIGSIEFSKYASKGVFEDLYAYMEKDGINRADYLENVFKAYEVDGKLYGFIPQFYINTMAAKTSKVGKEPGWTLQELLDFAEANNPENLFSYGSRDSIFYYCIYNNIDDFINWETGECHFNSEEFIRTLEFAAKFPKEPDYNDEEGTSAKLRNDKVLLMQTSVSSVQEYQMMNGLFGEEVTFIGYPNSESKGNLIQPTSGSVAISAKSKHKDGAWEFVKVLLSEEYQSELVNGHAWGFPVMKSALEKQFEMDMTPEYYTDENGKQVESPKTTWGYDDFQMEIMAASQAEVDAVREMITSAEKTATSINEELNNIIQEETAAFFSSQKSAKDTADVIQNRVQIYVNENR